MAKKESGAEVSQEVADAQSVLDDAIAARDAAKAAVKPARDAANQAIKTKSDADAYLAAIGDLTNENAEAHAAAVVSAEGWAAEAVRATTEADAAVAAAAAASEAVKAARSELKTAEMRAKKIAAGESVSEKVVQNGVTLPDPETKVGIGFVIADELTALLGRPATVGEVITLGESRGMTVSNARNAFNRWRQFHGHPNQGLNRNVDDLTKLAATYTGIFDEKLAAAIKAAERGVSAVTGGTPLERHNAKGAAKIAKAEKAAEAKIAKAENRAAEMVAKAKVDAITKLDEVKAAVAEDLAKFAPAPVEAPPALG